MMLDLERIHHLLGIEAATRDHPRLKEINLAVVRELEEIANNQKPPKLEEVSVKATEPELPLKQERRV